MVKQSRAVIPRRLRPFNQRTQHRSSGDGSRPIPRQQGKQDVLKLLDNRDYGERDSSSRCNSRGTYIGASAEPLAAGSFAQIVPRAQNATRKSTSDGGSSPLERSKIAQLLGAYVRTILRPLFCVSFSLIFEGISRVQTKLESQASDLVVIIWKSVSRQATGISTMKEVEEVRCVQTASAGGPPSRAFCDLTEDEEHIRLH
ncbi:uncharacterized protein BDZ83DRAFT_131261 [Colletotrichum acutatum]|uniref:Uncharacterized protein n=1 Tax=Glomerella acutata TaxID=27357 RepID=A0AAD8UDL6_GLOAC|nr:uncharacterized protein BDZ83DRAFT_131261 [Colletotrichum acutatum]KAK1710335.1 hypothetical protein BDZ83DRAFT_131261 [Colletotrichum acutatum]